MRPQPRDASSWSVFRIASVTSSLEAPSVGKIAPKFLCSAGPI